MAAQPDPTPDETPVSRLTEAEEQVARGIVAGYRARLDWMLRVPDWVDLFSEGILALELPGQRQGIGLQAAILALPLESKHALVSWAIEHRRSHVRSTVGRRLCRMFGLDLFERLELDELLTARQWQRLRDAALFRLGQEHRRYKHAQQLLFTGYHHLVERVVAQVAFRREHQADCAQEGALGLLAAIDRVDEAGGSLGAYATAWIRRHVRNYLLRQRLPVQAPVNLVAEAVTWRNTPAGEAAETSAAAADEARRLHVLLLECLRHPAVQLDEPLEHGAGTVAETVADSEVACPAESASRADLYEVISRGLAALTDKQRDVVVHRFGLGGVMARTLSEIARGAGISHQQAGMRERRALQRLEAALAPVAAELYGAV